MEMFIYIFYMRNGYKIVYIKDDLNLKLSKYMHIVCIYKKTFLNGHIL